MQEIEIIIDEQGNIAVEGRGFVGPECEAATRFIEAALGKVVERRRKPEYYLRQKGTGLVGQGQ